MNNITFFYCQDTINALTNQNSELKSQMLQGFHDHSTNPADLSSDEVSGHVETLSKLKHRTYFFLLKGRLQAEWDFKMSIFTKCIVNFESNRLAMFMLTIRSGLGSCESLQHTLWLDVYAFTKVEQFQALPVKCMEQGIMCWRL